MTTPPKPPQLLRTREVADLLGVSRSTVRAMAARGDLRPVALSPRATRYSAEDVQALIAERTRDV